MVEFCRSGVEQRILWVGPSCLTISVDSWAVEAYSVTAEFAGSLGRHPRRVPIWNPRLQEWKVSHMRLLSGSTRLAGLLIVLFTLATMLPSSWSSSGSYVCPGATSAWAGSPDETLNPPPEPPKKGASFGSYATSTTTEATIRTRLDATVSRTGWSWTERFGFAWRYYLSKVLRF